jgi:hypothetical protein
MLLHLKLVSQRLCVFSPQDGRVKISNLPCGYARLVRDNPHMYEPIASRAPPKALASQAGLGRARLVVPHTQRSLAHWNPSRAGLVRVWAPLHENLLFSCLFNVGDYFLSFFFLFFFAIFHFKSFYFFSWNFWDDYESKLSWILTFSWLPGLG